MAKRRYRKEFREFAVERLRGCENIVALARELHVSRRQLYRWRDELDPEIPGMEAPGQNARASTGEPFEAGVGGKDPGGGFFQKCLAKSRGSTPAEQQVWREGIYEQIREMMPLQGSLSVERMCELAPVSRAGFYRWLQEPQSVEEEMEVRSLIQQIAMEHRRRYGYRRISAELRRRGMAVNHKRVARIMREDNLLAVQPRQFVVTTKSDHKLEVYLNLARRLKLTGMDQLWVADITYIRLKTEFVYLAVILDGFSRKIVGWWLARSLATRLPVAALEQAIATRKPALGLVHHSDRGVQYASEEYVGVLERHGMIPSMSRPANPYDNASCESFLKTLKREEIYANQYRDLDHLRVNIEEFIDRYYNQQRLHSALGYRSPEEFERHAQRADPMTQLCSPSLEFFPGSEEKISTRMLEQGTQTPSPAPDLIPG